MRWQFAQALTERQNLLGHTLFLSRVRRLLELLLKQVTASQPFGLLSLPVRQSCRLAPADGFPALKQGLQSLDPLGHQFWSAARTHPRLVFGRQHQLFQTVHGHRITGMLEPVEPKATIADRLNTDPGQLITQTNLMIHPTKSDIRIGATGRTHRLSHQIQIKNQFATSPKFVMDGFSDEWLIEVLDRSAQVLDGGFIAHFQGAAHIGVMDKAGLLPGFYHRRIFHQRMVPQVQVLEILDARQQASIQLDDFRLWQNSSRVALDFLGNADPHQPCNQARVAGELTESDQQSMLCLALDQPSVG